MTTTTKYIIDLANLRCPSIHFLELDRLLKKLVIYMLMYAVIKVNPDYFSADVYKSVSLHEKDFIKQVQEMDEGITVNDPLVSLFEKERMH